MEDKKKVKFYTNFGVNNLDEKTYYNPIYLCTMQNRDGSISELYSAFKGDKELYVIINLDNAQLSVRSIRAEIAKEDIDIPNQEFHVQKLMSNRELSFDEKMETINSKKKMLVLAGPNNK